MKTPVPVNRIDDLAQDLAARHHRTPSAGDQIDKAVVDADLAQLASDGYLILPNLLSAKDCADIRRAVHPLLGEPGRNAFEGVKTRRAYSVMAKTRAVDQLVDHPRVLALLDRLLDPNYLLSQLQVIDIGAGESAQIEHFDDAMYPIPRPRPALSAATVWAIDEFTPDNGATVVLPGSHHWDSQRRPATSDKRRPAVMPAGSCVFFLDTLWHGGGANTTDRNRLAVTAQYCQPWLRSQEAFALSTPQDIVRQLSPDLQRMLGYSIHPPICRGSQRNAPTAASWPALTMSDRTAVAPPLGCARPQWPAASRAGGRPRDGASKPGKIRTNSPGAQGYWSVAAVAPRIGQQCRDRGLSSLWDGRRYG